MYEKTEQVQEKTNTVILTADNIALEGTFKVTKGIYLKDDTKLPAEKKLRAGDCFMFFASGSKAHIGKSCFIEKDTNYYAGGFMGILRANKSAILPQYLCLVLNTSSLRDKL